MEKVVSVLSGGLDSTVLLYKLVKDYGLENVYVITYRYGQKHSIEIAKAIESTHRLGLQDKHLILDISFLGELVKDKSSLSSFSNIEVPEITDILGDPQPVTYVPFRNLIFHSIALSYAENIGATKVFLGLQEHDLYSYWDTSEDFVKAVNSMTSLNRQSKITLETPFIRMSKEEEIRLGIELGVDFKSTWTCYRGPREGQACGVCPSCSERIMNFIKAGIEDPIPYEIDIDWKK